MGSIYVATLLQAIPTLKWESGAESVGYTGGDYWREKEKGKEKEKEKEQEQEQEQEEADITLNSNTPTLKGWGKFGGTDQHHKQKTHLL